METGNLFPTKKIPAKTPCSPDLCGEKKYSPQRSGDAGVNAEILDGL
jgi:hypothetical protein